MEEWKFCKKEKACYIAGKTIYRTMPLERMPMSAQKSERNRTLSLSGEEKQRLRSLLRTPDRPLAEEEVSDRVFCGDMFTVAGFLPERSADLLILDPPYNLAKDFNGWKFSRIADEEYREYIDRCLRLLLRVLKPGASVYLCGDWRCSAALYSAAGKYLKVRNRISWQREKGRGARKNWKNCTEDIWFATLGNDYYFNPDAVKIRRKVIAPYKLEGKPKDWEETGKGNFRMTCASNFWDDITIPFWSMPENTAHPTQKPEKLIAKLILASCPENGLVLDPFLGSGTSAVVAAKLGRRYCGIELNAEYCCWALKRLESAKESPRIQGYADGVFWERNSDPGNSGVPARRSRP